MQWSWDGNAAYGHGRCGFLLRACARRAALRRRLLTRPRALAAGVWAWHGRGSAPGQPSGPGLPGARRMHATWLARGGELAGTGTSTGGGGTQLVLVLFGGEGAPNASASNQSGSSGSGSWAGAAEARQASPPPPSPPARFLELEPDDEGVPALALFCTHVYPAVHPEDTGSTRIC